MIKYSVKFFLFSLSIIFLSSTLSARELSQAELEKWFNSDDEHPSFKVNEGQLNFLTTKPGENIFHSKINIHVDQTSIDHGWTRLTQCYSNLDPIYRTAVVYRKNLIKDLRVISSNNIGQTEVVENKVLLRDVKKNASLCIAATARNFYQNEDKSFSLVNGPYHRRFLDGYYPYHLTLNIRYSPKLKFKFNLPQEQKGFQVTKLDNTLSVNTVFEGRLKTEFRFDLTE